MKKEYTAIELNILWYLKRNGPMTGGPGESILGTLSEEFHCTTSWIGATLKQLEEKSLLLRTYLRGKSEKFGAGGNHPMILLELVDPNMSLPSQYLPPAVVIVKENRELEERTATEPSLESMMMALVERIGELQGQIDKLQQIVIDQEGEVERLRAAKSRAPVWGGLTQRVRDSLTPEQWESLRHPKGEDRV